MSFAPLGCDRIAEEVARAREALVRGDAEKYRRIMKVIASIADAESIERDPSAPVAEV